MRTLLRRVIRWALAPTEAERAAVGLLPGETATAFIQRKRAEILPRLPLMHQKAGDRDIG